MPDEITPDEQNPDETAPPEGDEVSETETESESDDWRKGFDPDKARAKIRKQNSELKGLRERAKAAEDKAAGADEKDQRITALEATNLRYEVAYEIGLPRELVARLQGDSREALLEDAEQLLNLVTPANRTSSRRPIENLRGGLEPDAEPAETNVRRLGERMFRH